MKNTFFKPKAVYACLVIMAMCAWAPIDFLQELQRNYDQYQEKYTSVKINLVFAQPLFTPGDTAFFSAWYMTEDLQAIKGDHLITLDLLAGNGSTAQRIHFKVHNGKGYNQMVLRQDLPVGNYRFVAYSEWMRNFGEAWYYQKKIQVVSKNELLPLKRDVRADFFPEGGQLVEGISNKVAVVGPPATELTVKDASSTETIKVLLDSTGTGSFLITPKPNQTYSAEWPSSGKAWSLPVGAKDGLGVQVVTGETCELLLSLPTGSNLANKEIYAIVNSRGKIMIKQRVTITDGQPFHVQVPRHDKGEALHQLYVFDAGGQLLAERVFIPYSNKNVQVKIKFPSEVKQRESLTGSVEVLDASGNTLESDLTVTVIQNKLFKGYSQANYFDLSELPAAVERAEKFGSAHLTSFNDFLITQKWRRINWETILKGKVIDLRFPFQSQARLKGNVTSLTTGEPPRDSTVIISYLQKNGVGFEAYTKNGQFEVPFVFDFWGDDKVFCTLQYRAKNIDNNFSIFIPKDSLTFTERWTSTESPQASVYGDYALSKELVFKSYSFFGSNQQNVSLVDKNPNSAIEEEFSGADYSVKVTDYVVFPKMEDLLREVVPFVQYRKRGNDEQVRISFRYETSTRTYKDDPLYVIDGVMTKNTAIFVNLKPENLVSIKVINNPNKLAQLSRLGENGVIFVETKKRDFVNSLINQNLFPVTGLSRQSNLYQVSYSGTNTHQRIPDLRPTLYWNPTLMTDKTGITPITFFASDDVGPMRILVQGVTRDGKTFIAEQDFKVGFNNTPK